MRSNYKTASYLRLHDDHFRITLNFNCCNATSDCWVTLKWGLVQPARYTTAGQINLERLHAIREATEIKREQS